MAERAREQLYNALLKSGKINQTGSPFGANKHGRTSDQAREVLGTFVKSAGDLSTERYRRHGLAKIEVPINFTTVTFFIDTEPLNKISTPKAAWIDIQLPDRITIAISSGKQKSKDNALEFDESRTLEGLDVTITPKSRTQVPSQYGANINPVYSD